MTVEGDEDDAQLLIVGFGSTYGHLHTAMTELRKRGYRVALAQFKYVNPLPKNTAEVLLKYPKCVVAEQNLGQLVALLRGRINGFVPYQYNKVMGQPFSVADLVKEFSALIDGKANVDNGDTFISKVL